MVRSIQIQFEKGKYKNRLKITISYETTSYDVTKKQSSDKEQMFATLAFDFTQNYESQLLKVHDIFAFLKM